ncbi:hypothetical protein WQE_15346 [Paraburkholderia hospita]|uniref:Lipoprotein n=2 Tax=Paraburkholderia hospita TaxID=169430 RepID=A0ABP2PRJ3_9BURK|nr:hypothetical protein WQE_15346 [Paraburkholderia hospita]OUL88431.1 hypothetical protein CA602_11255 [Paraburkholderia hospita]
MRNFLLLTAVLTSSLLTGCGKDTPDDELTARVVRPNAESGVTGVEVIDYQRDNGWVDPQSANRYIVRYKFNWELKKPFFDIALARAKGERAEGSGGMFSLSDGTIEWLQKHDSNERSTRIDAMKAKCPACAAWLSEGDEDETRARLNCFEDIWNALEKVGFKDTDLAGAKTPRTAWATFVKTEKGWEAG